MPHARGQVIGTPITVGSLDSIAREVVGLARAGQRGFVCLANVHMLTTALAQPRLRALLDEARIVASDGRPLVWVLHRRGHAAAEQVRGPDLLRRLCALAGDLPIFLYGGREGVAARAAERLAAASPGLRVVGAEAPPPLPEEPPLDPEAVRRIRASGARLVLVGLGCPKQELWMRAHAPYLDAVLVGLGQAFDIAAGRLGEAPGWMQARGLEWLYRLAHEPRRLWRRYLLGNARFLGALLAEELRTAAGRAGGGNAAPTAR
jgi:N-acetylglucosaminyldiphosphoundecaprenol N-acetyl-beta-D-mannosaminyltransferase